MLGWTTIPLFSCPHPFQPYHKHDVERPIISPHLDHLKDAHLWFKGALYIIVFGVNRLGGSGVKMPAVLVIDAAQPNKTMVTHSYCKFNYIYVIISLLKQFRQDLLNLPSS